jgi:NAD-dependent dihydropyrimidine dehydrogenase PreA subunit
MIVQIDELKCDGCGLCIPACAEGAIALVAGKARLSAELLCDGLGACLGECPQGAITVVEREADAFDEEAVKAHLERLGRPPPALHAPAAVPAPAPRPRLSVVAAGPAEGGGCPGSRPLTQPRRALAVVPSAGGPALPTTGSESRLGQWPVQLHLVPVNAPYLQGADLLVAADCVPFAYPRFHEDLLAGKALVVGCPKLDDLAAYADKLARICSVNELRSVTVVRMEVPCCGGISTAARRALTASGKAVPFHDVVVGVDGAIRS